MSWCDWVEDGRCMEPAIYQCVVFYSQSDRVMQVFRYCEAHVRAFDPDLVVIGPATPERPDVGPHACPQPIRWRGADRQGVGWPGAFRQIPRPSQKGKAASGGAAFGLRESGSVALTFLVSLLWGYKV